MIVAKLVQSLCNVMTKVNANANQDSQDPSVMNVCLNLKGTSVTNVPQPSMDTQTAKIVDVMSKDLKTRHVTKMESVLATKT